VQAALVGKAGDRSAGRRQPGRGLLALADCWSVTASFRLAPVAIGDALTGIAALISAVLLVAYGWKAGV
jgi:hypothetical protein